MQQIVCKTHINVTRSIRPAGIKMDRNYQREMLPNILSVMNLNFKIAVFYIRIFISIDPLEACQSTAGRGLGSCIKPKFSFNLKSKTK